MLSGSTDDDNAPESGTEEPNPNEVRAGCPKIGKTSLCFDALRSLDPDPKNFHIRIHEA